MTAEPHNRPARRRGAHAIEKAASHWVARQALGTLGEEDRQAFSAWLAADPAHGETYRRLSGALAAADGAGSIMREADRRARKQEAVRRRRTTIASGVTGCMALLALMTVDLPGQFADERAGRGEIRVLELADGSRLWLDATAAVDIDYSEKERSIRLVRGRIHVEVAHEARPFRVTALAGEALDVGTAFDVDLGPDAVETIVTEGRVLARSAGSDVMLHEGEAARWTANEAPERLPEPGTGRTAWRHGRLVFDREPLEQVLTVLDRYSSKRLYLLAPAARSRLVSGVVRSGQVDESIVSITRAQGLSATDIGVAILLH